MCFRARSRRVLRSVMNSFAMGTSGPDLTPPAGEGGASRAAGVDRASPRGGEPRGEVGRAQKGATGPEREREAGTGGGTREAVTMGGRPRPSTGRFAEGKGFRDPRGVLA